MEKVIFIHIPKCAVITVNSIIRKNGNVKLKCLQKAIWWQ